MLNVKVKIQNKRKQADPQFLLLNFYFLIS